MTRYLIAQKALTVAIAYAKAGVHEEGGNNRGDQVEAFLHLFGVPAGEPWCACFVGTCFVKAYAFLAGEPADRASLPKYKKAVEKYVPLSPSVQSMVNTAKAKGWFRPKTAKPNAGWLVVYDWSGDGHADHVELLQSVDRRDKSIIHTVGGNTPEDGGNQRDGDGVFQKTRDLSRVMGYIDTDTN